MSIRIRMLVTNVYRLVISICFILILSFLCGYSGVMTATFIDWEHTAYIKDSVCRNLLAVILTVMLGTCIKYTRAYQKILDYIADDRKFQRVKQMLILIIMLLGGLWVLCTQFVPGVDEWEVMETVVRANRDEFSTFKPTAYMDWYPNQWGCFCLSMFFR